MSQTKCDTSSNTEVEDGEVTQPLGQALTHYEAVVRRVVQNDLDKRIEAVTAADKSREHDIELFDSLLTELVEVASEDFIEKVDAASQEGHRNAEVFVFDGADKFKDTDFSILFLIKGPKRQGQDFFLRLGLLPFMARMYQAVRPFDVTMEYLPESNENIVRLGW